MLTPEEFAVQNPGWKMLLGEPAPPVDLGLHGTPPHQLRGVLIRPRYECHLQRVNPLQVKKKPEERDDVLEGLGGDSLVSAQEAYDEAMRQFAHWRRDKLDFYRWRYAKHLLERAIPEVRARLKEPRWFKRHWDDECPDQYPPKTFPSSYLATDWGFYLNQVYEAAWGDHATVLKVFMAREGCTHAAAYNALSEWFRDPMNYN